jgi:hypothetical protein
LVHRIGDNDLWHDRLAYSVQREDFFRKTLNVLRLSRAALIYLSLGMHSEETRRLEERDHRHLMSMPLHLWPDDWKF